MDTDSGVVVRGNTVRNLWLLVPVFNIGMMAINTAGLIYQICANAPEHLLMVSLVSWALTMVMTPVASTGACWIWWVLHTTDPRKR